ncbi:hypothetical protein [Microcoleus sp. K4-B3]|uniref:hypothetical protein n=1 Tax=Microcoleus sp. K4-B3 TaxID=2818791 RepID=UPI002FCEBB7E
MVGDSLSVADIAAALLSPLALIPQYPVEHPWLFLAFPKFTHFVGKPSLRDVKVYRSGDRPCLKISDK